MKVKEHLHKALWMRLMWPTSTSKTEGKANYHARLDGCTNRDKTNTSMWNCNVCTGATRGWMAIYDVYLCVFIVSLPASFLLFKTNVSLGKLFLGVWCCFPTKLTDQCCVLLWTEILHTWKNHCGLQWAGLLEHFHLFTCCQTGDEAVYFMFTSTS